ncbi:facilitated trehalose transporter Tret1-like [Sitophilus oryzae]|uniref:Facilitated trehalose transporter Tret1-like n=1 Tax=Sitophilus oryzae TaxID=7048 RepID=A0A6J2Y954_SITOR|nr:facilitated trehalose transporter Tret1-like [Sitophilus oryzae]
MCLGAMFVCIPIGVLADAIGRKWTTLLTVIPFSIGWLAITFAQNTAMVLVGRFLTGMAGGSFCIVAPLYTSETAQTEIRGTLGAFFQLFITIGILYAQVLGFIFGVKLFCFACLAVPIAFGICYIFQPETPVYLMKKRNKEGTESAFKRLRGKDYDPSGEINSIRAELDRQEALKGEFWPQLKTPQGKKSSLICFMLMFYQQLSGINAVMFYSGAIFVDAGSTINPAYCTIIIGVVQVFATVFATWGVEKLGRKILLMLSDGAMAFSTFLMGIYFLLKEKKMVSDETITGLGWLPLLSLVIFIIAFSFGMGPIPWLASAELFPPAIMARMSSCAGMFNWFLAFLVTIGYAPVSNMAGAFTTFFIFTLVSASGVLFVLFVMPETKGKTFQEIQDELGH